MTVRDLCSRAEVEPYVTDTIWVGKMQRFLGNKMRMWDGFTTAAARIKSQQTDAEVLQLVKALGDNPKVR